MSTITHDPPTRHQREADAWDAWARREGLADLTTDTGVAARKAWKAALVWKEGRLQSMEGGHLYERGNRVCIIEGDHKGQEGTVEFVEPSGRVWVMRDTASTATFYYAAELQPSPPPPPPERRATDPEDP